MTLTEWELPAVIDLQQLGDLGTPLSSGDGQSVSVTPLNERPSFLFKQYKTPGDRRESVRLDELIGRPETEPTLTTLLRTSTSWPVARVHDTHGGALGCVIPRAPESFLIDVEQRPPLPRDKRTGEGLQRRYLDVDLLAASPERLTRLGVKPPTLDERMTAVRGLVQIADSLEKLNLVYSDWSYSNAFWSPRDNAVYVIDVDGCAVGSGANIFQPNWEDPLTAQSQAADTYVERYRVALLAARCLTNQRAVPNVVARLRDTTSPVCGSALREALLDMMLMSSRENRPPVSALRAVLEGGPYVVFPHRRFDVPPPPELAPAPTPVPVSAPSSRPSSRPGPTHAASARSSQAPSRGRGPLIPGVMAAVVVVVLALILLALVVGQ